MTNYSIFKGVFQCHTCKEDVKVLRLYTETTDLTWMCAKKHVSKVTILQRRSSERKR